MSNLNCTLSAIVLAGGKSSRMGRDKALIEVEGIPLIERTIQIARSLCASTCVVTSTPDKYRAYLQGCEVVAETNPQGALIGFAKGLAQVNADWVLLLACDLPKLKLEPIAQWRDELPEIEPDAIAYLPHQSKGWEPLCGFYRRTSLPDLQAYIAAGGRSFQKWLDRHLVQAIPAVNSDLFFNCNTPADLDSITDEPNSDRVNSN